MPTPPASQPRDPSRGVLYSLLLVLGLCVAGAVTLLVGASR